MIVLGLLTRRKFLANVTLNYSIEIFQNCSREIFVIDSFLKINLWTYKIKDLNGEKVIKSFYQKDCCWVKYK